MKIPKVELMHISACGLGKTILRGTFSLQPPFELQLRAFNLAMAAAAQNNPHHPFKRPPTLNKLLSFLLSCTSDCCLPVPFLPGCLRYAGEHKHISSSRLTARAGRRFLTASIITEALKLRAPRDSVDKDDPSANKEGK